VLFKKFTVVFSLHVLATALARKVPFCGPLETFARSAGER